MNFNEGRVYKPAERHRPLRCRSPLCATSMKGGFINPPNINYDIDTIRHLSTSMKGGFINPPNLILYPSSAPSLLYFNEGRVYKPAEPPHSQGQFEK